MGDGRACHRKCLKRSIEGKSWVDHKWTSKMHSLWSRGWTCKRCGLVVWFDPTRKDTRDNAYRQSGASKDCGRELVDRVSKS